MIAFHNIIEFENYFFYLFIERFLFERFYCAKITSHYKITKLFNVKIYVI